MEVLIAGVPYPLSSTPLPFPFLRIPYPFQRLLRRLETSGVSWFSHDVTKFKLGDYRFFRVSTFMWYDSTLKPSSKQIKFSVQKVSSFCDTARLNFHWLLRDAAFSWPGKMICGLKTLGDFATGTFLFSE